MTRSKQLVFRMLMLITVATVVVVLVLHISNDNLKVKTKEEGWPLIVIGVLTAADKRAFRDAQRETWIANALRTDINFRFKYKFLIDEPTKDTETENKIYNDILYLNITTHGYAVKFGEKNYVWFKYIHEHYPDAMLGARVDDDVYLCIPQIFDRLSIFQSHNLHYGWEHPRDRTNIRNIDEMFIVLGDVVMKRIAERKYCTTDYVSGCDIADMKYGGLAIQEWLKIYDDIDSIGDNLYMIHFGRDETHLFAKHINKDFCNRWALYHKASPGIMRKLHGFQMASTTN